MIYPGVFFYYYFYLFFLILIFWTVRGVKVQKNSPKCEIIITPVTHHITGTVQHMIMIFRTLLMISLGFFFFFF